MKTMTSLPLLLLSASGAVLGLGCNTRTPIGWFDAGTDDGTTYDDGSFGHGMGGHVGSGGAGGTVGAGGTGDALGQGGQAATGGRTGAAGGSTSTGGSGAGGVDGATACQEYTPAPGGAAGGSGSSCQGLVYPASGFYGANILGDGCTALPFGPYELAVKGTTDSTVVVKMTLLTSPSSNVAPGVNGYALDNQSGDWRNKNPSMLQSQQQDTLQSRPIEENETAITFVGMGSARIDIYDCDPNSPSRSKIISWGPPAP